VKYGGLHGSNGRSSGPVCDQLPLLDHVPQSQNWNSLGCLLGDGSHFSPGDCAVPCLHWILELTIGPAVASGPMGCGHFGRRCARRSGVAWQASNRLLRLQSGTSSAYCGRSTDIPVERASARTPVSTRASPRGLHHLADGPVRWSSEPMSRFRTHVVNTPQQAMTHRGPIAESGGDAGRHHLITGAGLQLRRWNRLVHTKFVGDCTPGKGNDRGVPGGSLVPWGAFSMRSTYRATRRAGDAGNNAALRRPCRVTRHFPRSLPGPGRFVRQKGLTL